MEVSNIRPQGRKHLASFFVVSRTGTVGIFTHIVQRGCKNLCRGVQERDTTLAQLGDIFRFEHSIPAVHLEIRPHHFGHLLGVKADTGSATEIRNRMSVVRIFILQQLHNIRVHIHQIWQFALIQRSKNASLDLTSQKIGTGNDDIKSRSAGQ